MLMREMSKGGTVLSRAVKSSAIGVLHEEPNRIGAKTFLDESEPGSALVMFGSSA